MKILHTADWHIGQFKGPVVDGVNLRSQDTVKMFGIYGTGSYRRETGYRLRIRRYLSPGTGWPREVFRRNDYGNEHHYIISTFFEVCDRDARHSKSRWSCSV